MHPRLIPAAILAMFAVPAPAADFTDVATVVSAVPVYERVAEPRQECQMENVGTTQSGVPASAPQERSVLGPVIGGVAGAIIGAQVGGGRGRQAATAVGAVAGTVVGDRVANPNSPSSTTGAVVGGAAGAVLGGQIGRGSGQTAATAAGAIGGAIVGDRVGSRGQQPVGQPTAGAPVQRCRVVDGGLREVVKGYQVTYRYNGREGTAMMPYHPGESVRVAVGVVDAMPAQGTRPTGTAPVAQPAVVPAGPHDGAGMSGATVRTEAAQPQGSPGYTYRY